MATITQGNIAQQRKSLFEEESKTSFQGDWKYRLFSYLLLTLLGVTMVVPFLWMISTSFKPLPEVTRANFFPVNATIENYEHVLFNTALPRWYLNSLVVAIMSTVSVAFFDTLAGYVFAKFTFPGKQIIFILFLSSLMVPTEMLIIPWYIMSVDPIIGGTWVDTYWGIAFPGMITATGVFLMRQFMQGVPDELLDAGRIDGVSEFGLFWRIAVPLSLPAIGALCIFNFLGNWNAFIWPLMIVIIFQRYIIEGIALTGLKG
jgi:multiple sugar transport system permease protein